MKRFFRKGVITAIGVLLLSSAVLPAPAYAGSAFTKLGRGIANMATCLLEIPHQMGETNKTDGPFAACTTGVLKAVIMTCGRCLVGAYEVLSFPVPVPKDYGPILRNPEYFFEGTVY